jgi:6-phosphogluconolactonase/glucosamine-6-phosphate isomerase/deaminase
MHFIIQDDPNSVEKYIGQYIACRINNHNLMLVQKFVLGLPTGLSPISIYKYLIRPISKLSFKHVIMINIDGYIGLPKEHRENYHTFMYVSFHHTTLKYHELKNGRFENLFSHNNIFPEQVNLFKMTLSKILLANAKSTN